MGFSESPQSVAALINIIIACAQSQGDGERGTGALGMTEAGSCLGDTLGESGSRKQRRLVAVPSASF